MADPKRDYRKEYDEYQGTPKQRANRKKRDTARRELEKEGRVHKGDGKEIDHKKPLSKGGSNKKSNLRVTTQKANRQKGNRTEATK